MSLEICRLTDLDPIELAPLVEASLAEGHGFVQRRVNEWQSGEVRFDKPGEAFFGAYLDGRLVGVGGLNHISPLVGRVRTLYVFPELRGQGIGKALVQRILEAAQGKFSELILNTRDAGAFYERLGFAPTPIREATHWMALQKPLVVHDSPQPLHPAIRNVWRWSSVIGWAIMAVIGGVAEFFYMRFALHWNWFPVASPIFCAAMAGLAWWIAGKQYAAWTYQLRPHDLVMSHGLVWKSRRCVARGRVQHIDINSGPLDRRWGLVQVSIYVAGGLGSVGSIPGLTPEDAEALRTAILEGRASNA